MANPDRPKGFTPVKTFWGSPWSGLVRSIGVGDGADMFRGDAIKLSSGLALTITTATDDVLGVAIGFGRDNAMHGELAGMFDPSNLETRWYDDSANTHTEWRVWYVPAEGVIFEAQSSADLAVDDPIGDIYSILLTAGDTTTGVSAHELEAEGGEGAFSVVGVPRYPDNDITLTNARYWGVFDNTAYMAGGPL